eukprot:599191-Hanusia_phi.AAC.7
MKVWRGGRGGGGAKAKHTSPGAVWRMESSCCPSCCSVCKARHPLAGRGWWGGDEEGNLSFHCIQPTNHLSIDGVLWLQRTLATSTVKLNASRPLPVLLACLAPALA